MYYQSMVSDVCPLIRWLKETEHHIMEMTDPPVVC